VNQQGSDLGFGVRRGRSNDFDAVSALYSAVAAEGLWIGAEAPVEWTSQRRQAWSRTADEDDRGAWFLAEDEAARLAGYIAVTRSGAEHADFGMSVSVPRFPGRRPTAATWSWTRALPAPHCRTPSCPVRRTACGSDGAVDQPVGRLIP
jgi:hypothetical protein